MIRKQFDQELFEQNDGTARNAVLQHMDSVGLYCKENDDLYGPDLILYSGLKPLSYIEVEVKQAWKHGDFPFSTIQLPSRKAKFIKKGRGLSCEFWILRSDLKFAIIIPDYILEDEMLVEVPNKYIASGEMFYQVPLDLCIQKRL